MSITEKSKTIFENAKSFLSKQSPETLLTAGVAISATFTGIARIIDAVAHHKGASAYSKMINNRSKRTR